jgi:hypothetical protein
MLKQLYQSRDGVNHNTQKDGLRHEMTKAIPAAIIEQIQGSYAALNNMVLNPDGLKPLVTAMLQNPNAMRSFLDQYIAARDTVAQIDALEKHHDEQAAA